MTVSGLNDSQTRALVITERVNAVVSLLGIAFILGTYLFTPYFSKPINRLVFYATWGNLGSHIASLISEAGPNAGPKAPLCQFQAFLVQMFLGVDAYWALCMAANVYLVFFRSYTVKQLRRLDMRYLLGCYGASFVPAFIYIFISTKERGRIYGLAIIWCWVDKSWDYLRILTLYGIVWLAIFMAFVIYLMAAKVIWNKREILQGFLNPMNEYPFAFKTTEIRITREERRGSESGQINMKIIGSPSREDYNPYEAHIEVGELPNNNSKPTIMRLASMTRIAAEQEDNSESFLYARVAILFFFALLLVWGPSSANRLYGLAHPDEVNFGLNYASSFLFPLQGLLNAIIYTITSRTACRELCLAVRNRNHIARKASLPAVSMGHRRSESKPKNYAAPGLRHDSDVTSVTSLTYH